MQPDFSRSESERILKKYTCPGCGERTARIDMNRPADEAIACWNCSANIGRTVGEFQKDIHALGWQQIQDILTTTAAMKSPAE